VGTDICTSTFAPSGRWGSSSSSIMRPRTTPRRLIQIAPQKSIPHRGLKAVARSTLQQGYSGRYPSLAWRGGSSLRRGLIPIVSSRFINGVQLHCTSHTVGTQMSGENSQWNGNTPPTNSIHALVEKNMAQLSVL